MELHRHLSLNVFTSKFKLIYALALACMLFRNSLAMASVSLSGFTIEPSGGTTPPSHTASAASTTNEVIYGDGFELLSLTGSAYLSLVGDVSISTPRSLLSKTIYVSHDGWAYLQADGSYYSTIMPMGKLANVYIKLDGVKISNDSTVDWTGATHVSQHSFNAIAATYLTQGYHDISLNAEGQLFNVASSAGLSIVANVANQAYVSSLSASDGPFSFSLPSGGLPDSSVLPIYTVLSQMVSTLVGQPIISMASFSETNAGRPGDALATIYKDGNQPTISQGTWTNSDGFSPNIELRAPMNSQAFFPTATTSSAISLSASLYPWTNGGHPDNVSYSIDKGAQLISLVGGMTVYGTALTIGDTSANIVRYGDFRCIGSDQGWPQCVPTGTDINVAATTFTIPAGHSGEIFFSSKIRMQGDMSDTGGHVLLFLKLDGVQVGSTGVQGNTAFDGDSQRTLGASYLSAGDGHLAPGPHTIEVWMNAAGGYIHMSGSADLPLIYFD